MKYIDAVVFDFGQVLGLEQDSSRVEKMLMLTGLNRDEFFKRYRQFRTEYDRGKINGKEYWMRVIAGSKIKARELNGLAEKLIHEDMMSWLRPNTKIISWVEKLKGSSIKTGILSNMPLEPGEYVNKNFSWINLFDNIVFSCKVGFVKPEIEIYEYCIRGLKVEPARALLIDDDKQNLEGARKAGLQTFLYIPGITEPKEIAKKFRLPF